MTLTTFAFLWLSLSIACTLLGAILTIRQRSAIAGEEQP
jgi:hypothetical protein